MIFTIGHSNRSLEEFLKPLKDHQIEIIVDVRRFPTSKFEHFKKEGLEENLNINGIEYLHLPQLGGFRGGYLKYTESQGFKEGLKKLMDLATQKQVAIMCSERLWFRCHRRFIADELTRKGMKVIHLINGRKYEHKLRDKG